ncbi:MAG TPA: NAD(P)(+) transhydrogenase (Re/Si-specific) subunit alpha, partial [Mycobacteriales bacterium]|nr:NAD(P)(+) transhydrogenase (Re/Si-specific) subunit alpha [Mycobacteriales bacterium]
MSELAVGVVREGGAGERRVGLVPESVARLAARGLRTVVETGAGAAAWFPDAEYAAAGATVTDAVYEQSDVVVCLHPPDPAA